MAVDRQLNVQDAYRQRRRPGLIGDDFDGEDDHEEQMALLRNQRYNMLREDMKDEADDNRDLEEDAIDYDDYKGPI